MSYLKFLFNDKKGLAYWIAILVATILIAGISIMANFQEIHNPEFADYLYMMRLPLAVILIFVGYNSMGYATYRSQIKFKEFYLAKIESQRRVEVELSFESVAYAVPAKGGRVNVPIKSRVEPFEQLVIGKSIVLLGNSYDLGIFRIPLRPIQLPDHVDTTVKKLKYTTASKIKEIQKGEDGLLVSLSKPYKGIRQILIRMETDLL
jgi:Predicted membrane protein